MKLLPRVYASLLYLYPRVFRDEFAEEMLKTFADMATEASQGGELRLLAFCWREFRDLPIAVVREHLRERGNMKSRTGEVRGLPSVSSLGMFSAAAPFLLFALIAVINMLHLGANAVPDWLAYVFLSIFLLPLLIGLFRGIPRWCLPSIGVIASLISYGLRLSFHPNMSNWTTMSDPWIIRMTIQAGLSWVGLLVLTVSFLTITLVLPPLRSAYTRIRQDWTLLSYCLYGAMFMALVFTFEDYPPAGRGIYEIASALILAAGGWIYLRSGATRTRAFALFAAVTIAMAVATVGKALLISSPDWPFPHGDNDWQGEAIGTVVDGAWMLLVVFLPPLLVNFLPHLSQAKATHA
ncbi:MAG: hypothetical protein ACM3S0_16660 [Acidobacteriota bacterium]